MRHRLYLEIGPARFRIASAWRGPVEALARLYAAYPQQPGVVDFTVRLEPAGLMRRWWRPSIFITGDHHLPDAAPMALRHGLLAAEMGMNLQMALGWRRHLLLHASSAERDGRVLLMSGESGSGKSTLAAMLGERGWRFMGDEFALLDMATGEAQPFPRLVSLKNSAIAATRRTVAGEARFGPLLEGTPKGDIRHLVPPGDAIAGMKRGGRPALLLFPRFGAAEAARPIGAAEAFVRLTQASTNYVACGEPGFAALNRLVTQTPALAIDYPDGETGLDMVERYWRETA